MDIFEEIVRLRKAGRKGALATIIEVQGSIPSHESSKILIRDDGSIAGTVGGGCVEAEVWSVAQEVMREEKPRRLHFNLNANPEYDNGLICGGSLDIFVEPILATPTAFILGGGHVGLNVAKAAKLAGFEVVVADDREAFANKERFPEASETFAGPWEELFPKFNINNHTYLVLVTRGHKGDLDCLRWAVTTPARYVGMIGSKRKFIEICKVLEREGVTAERIERVHSPIGLDIGALTPEEIAVAIVAEMIAVRRNTAPSVPSLAHKPKAQHTT
jgi:xanthine dehydrogenase accessory factor